MSPVEPNILDQYAHSAWAMWSSIVILIGVALYTYDRYAKRWSAITGQHQTIGKVVFSEICKTGHGQSQALVSYIYEVAGATYKGVIPSPKVCLARFVDTHNPGDHIPVFYAQKDPAYSTAITPPTQGTLLQHTLPNCFALPLLTLHLVSLAIYSTQF